MGVVAVAAFGGNEDKFIKKYAMMKIYESCFGSDVVKQIRQEMKAACAKCASMESPITPPAPLQEHTMIPSVQGENHQESTKHDAVNTEEENSVHPKPVFDPTKLHQAILAYRPNPYQPTFRPFTPNNGFYPGFVSSGPMFYPGNPNGFQGGPMQYTPTYPHFPFFQPGFFGGGQRMSREMDIKSQLEALTARMSGRVRNVTCVMQELGYLNDNLEPNYEKIQAKIGTLPIPEELKKDIQDGVQFCQQFSQCVPEMKSEKSPLSNELIRPMFFFRCYKHKKLEACVMKDVRERFSGNGDDNMDEPEVEIRRTAKAEGMEDREIDHLASSVYEFLYGSDSMDFDAIL
ncbi:hypothetical protein CBL_06385 [Carabus blaptoides fortunei]